MAAADARWCARLYALAVLVGSFLLFLVEPMVARMALPRLGGAPAVWNSAMLVYQALLLGGYAWAHGLARLAPRAQAGAQFALLLLAGLTLPIGLVARDLPPDASPALWVPWLFGRSIGPLFLAAAAQAPLLQRWYALASGGRDPYALYAASNLGSFAGLLAYPLLAEPLLALPTQSRWWSLGYAVLVLLTLACAARLPRGGGERATDPISPAPGVRAYGRWIALAFAPSGLMLATSTYITTDIVAMPLLWVLPLGLYLLSFSVAFASGRATADLLTRIAPLTLLLFGGVMIAGYQAKPVANAGIALALLFMAAVALHTALYRERPAPDRLTGFYLATAAGGALGGVFCGLLAPVIFDWTYEYPLMILAAGALAPQVYLDGRIARWWRPEPRRNLLIVVAALTALVALRFAGRHPLLGDERQGPAFLVMGAVGLLTIGARRAYLLALATSLVIFGGAQSIGMSLTPGMRTRSYFGVYTVRDDARERQLVHGTTVHGIELLGGPARERMPTAYYMPGSGVGRAMAAAPSLYGPQARIAVVGLGAGTLSCYARPGQHWRFFEIDPAIVRIARTQFRFLPDCLPGADVVIGDARLSLAHEPAASRDLLALDAFSSDAIPVHLLTREAFATYARVLTPGGLLLVHISNRFMDLAPVVSAAARAGGWRAMQLSYEPSRSIPAASPSAWIALGREPRALALLASRDPAWRPLPPSAMRPWTDDHASILPVLKGVR